MKPLSSVVIALALLAPAVTFAQTTEAEPAPASTPAEPQSRAKLILEETALSMEMARDGQFGRIKSRDMEKLESAYGRMVELLSNVDEPSELPSSQRQTLALAQSEITEILNPDDENRRICKRVASTGTRLGALECLTVAERRQRARASRNMANDSQRGFCVPGSGNEGGSLCTFGGRSGG
jgi:hypothetical protein